MADQERGRNLRAVARYLSPEWIAQLDAALARKDVPPTDRLVVRQEVHGTPDGDVVYHLWFDGGRAGAGRGDGGAVAGFSTDWATAHAIATGTDSARAALLAGRLRLNGDVGELLRAAEGAEMAAVVDAALAEVATDA